MHFPTHPVLFFAATATFFQRTIGAPAPRPQSDVNPLPVGWPGWNNIEKLFVFGASYTTTGFDWLHGSAPSPDNPLGNDVRGRTSSNGPNFITYLTTTFNASKVLTYNFAFPGAEVDHYATNPTSAVRFGNDMRWEVNNGFIPSYTPQQHAPFAEWEGRSSLFISFFGINDILNYFRRPGDTSSVTTAVMDAYATHLEELYATGARNFLLLNSPPIAQAPFFNTGETVSGHNDHLTDDARASDRQKVQVVTEDYNSRFPSLVSSFQSSHPDATIFWYDTHGLFTSLLSSSSSGSNNQLATYTQAYNLPDAISNLDGSCEFYTQPSSPGGTDHVDYLGSDDAFDAVDRKSVV